MGSPGQVGGVSRRSGRVKTFDLRELVKLPLVRQLQEGSLGLSKGWPAWSRLDPGSVFRCIYTCFRDFEALRVDSQPQKVMLPLYLPCEIDLLGADLSRSGGPQLGVLWEPQETPRRPPGDPQMTPGKKKVKKKVKK